MLQELSFIAHRRQNKDERDGGRGILEHGPQLCGLGFNKPLSQVSGDIVLHGIRESVRPHALEDQQLLEIIKIALPVAW